MASIDPGVGDTAPPSSAYWRFYEQVAAAQLREWAPRAPSRVLDLSGSCARFAGQLVADGHEVLHACAGLAQAQAAARAVPQSPGRLHPVVGDPRALGWLRDESVDAVLAESRVLSLCLATEMTALDLRRVLRPGGTLLLVVDSLAHGLARLAGQGRWAELADVPSADVVLVPEGPGHLDATGGTSRCFRPEEVEALLLEVDLEVDWVRPRTALAPAAIERAVQQGGQRALRALVDTELGLARDQQGRLAAGPHLVVSARRPQHS